jgi:hypothetical protein
MPAQTDLETTLLGPVLADRACGDCTVCCTVLTVDTPDLKKPAGTPCEKLSAHGCSIHAVRPPICRTWFCAWRRLAAMPDAARPDRSGLLVSVNFVREPRNALEAISLNVRATRSQDSIDPGLVQTVLDSLCEGLVAVWYSDGSRKMLLHPENEVAQFVISGACPPPHLAQEVAAWRERYGAFLTKG